MSSGFDHVVASLEARFDHMSARTIAKEAATAAGLGEQKAYSPKDVQLLADTLATLGDRMDAVWAALGASPTGQAAAAPAPAPAAAPAAKAEEAPAAKADKAEAAEEAAEAKEDDKAEAKDEKAEAKGKDDKDAKKKK
jgi:hypothetical protein